VAVTALSAVAGCKKSPEPQNNEKAAPLLTAAQPPAAHPAPAAAANAVEITWTDPPGWERVKPSSPMRKASYRIPKAAGDTEDAELAVFYFGPGQGGGIDANVERWVKQFSGIKPDDVKRGDRQANGLRQHTVEIERGTFASGMPGAPAGAKENYGLLAGIVEAPTGSYFFKMTGPQKTVRGARDAFYKLLDSVKPGA
jgi:hypothetical protein